MKTLIFATNNKNKVVEIRSLFNNSIKVISLEDAKIFIEIPEPYDTLIENAIEKSNVIYKLTGVDCFAEDTGLEVAALKGEPGVKSARYAGEEKSPEKNIKKLLDKLAGITDRSANFKTIICLTVEGKHNIFEGVCKGIIIAKPRGNNGFGYDSVFIPDGSKKTFAEMELDEKNLFSHRKKAMVQLISFLKNTLQVAL